ncbi:HAD family hydrolase [Microbacterium caowuchunii]|uniref:HAD family hydrolase n=1 Tax=Microbacterium caowuchunii TaxID=2614638 RepID=UPI00177D3C6F|nr:HAD family hydrolase [Microbacterium caowuchunii]
MTEIRAVGFDLDGTLFDHRGAASTAVDAFLSSLGAHPSAAARELWFAAEEAEFERWRSGLITFQEQRRRRLLAVLPQLGVAIDEAPHRLDLLFVDYLSAYRAAWQAFPDVLDVLASLRSKGVRLGILTNGSAEQQWDKLQATGIHESVDVICISEEIGAQKPSREAFETLAQRLEVAPAECLFIGDDPRHDLAGARAAGMHAALIERYREGSGGLAGIVHSALAG